MRKERGFALAIVLVLLPVMALMAWTYLSIGTTTRAQALYEERKIRSYHAAEAGIRRYLGEGRADNFKMNGCEVTIRVSDTRIISTATPATTTRPTSIILEVEKGFVVRRLTNDEV